MAAKDAASAPVTVAALTDRVAVPVFLTFTESAAADPRDTDPRDRAAVDTSIYGSVPVPVSATSDGLPAALCVS